MTGRSLLGVSGAPDRQAVLSFLSEGVDPAYCIALREHIDGSESDFLQAGPESSVSEAMNLQKACQKEFRALQLELKTAFQNFREKWAQRLETSVLAPQLRDNGWITQADGGFKLDLGTSRKDIRDFYYDTVHLMVGDAEKLVVTAHSRSAHLQQRLAKTWYAETIESPASKILPTLEAGLRGSENALMQKLRESLGNVAIHFFSEAFRLRRTSRSFRVWKSEEAVVRNLGEHWNPAGIWPNGFRAYMEEFCDYASGISTEITDWYLDKWLLYLRGFSRGQLNLFAVTRAG